ncbi:MAG: AsmA family protein [Rhodobacteraceae bacterium]|nr:AsmA family protein [Paracoccaceae bacterium]
MRWIIRIVVAMVLVVLVAVGMLFLLPTERIGQIASDQLERATGRKLSLSGDFRPTLYPVLGVKTGRISISNADWAKNPVMIEAASASVGVSLSALIGGELEVGKLRLVDPVIRLEKAHDGRANWEFDSSAAQNGAGSSQTPDFSLELGEISNGLLTYQDYKTGDKLTVSKIDAALTLPKGAKTMALDGQAIWHGQTAKLSVEITDFPRLLADGVTALEAKAEMADATFGLAGTVGIGRAVPTLDGMVSFAASDLKKLLNQFDIALETPQEIKDFTTNGQIQFSAAGLYFSGKSTAQVKDLPLKASIELTGAEDWQQTLAFDLSTDVGAEGALALGFEGRVNGSKATLLGQLNLKSANPRRLFAAAGVAVDLPKGTFQNLAVAGDLRIKPSGEVILKKANLAVDQNKLSGRVSITTSGKPLITAKLSSKALNLSRFTSDSNGGNSPQTTEWSKEPISLTGLDAVDADVLLKAGSVNLGTSKLGKVDIKAKLRDGLLTLNLIDVRAYRGAMSGTVNIRGGKDIAFSSDVLAKNMQLKPLLGQMLGIDRLTGTGTTHLKLSGQGGSLHQVMNSLSGTGDIKFANGAFRGIDLAAMMKNLKSAFGGFEGATEFTSMTGSFSLKKGVLENVDLSLISPLFKAAGKGKVGIGGRSMDYVVTPSTLSGDAAVSVPVFITGPWHNLKFRPDLDKLIDLVLQGKLKDNAEVQKAREKLQKAKEKLKDPKATAKEKLRKKLAKELDNEEAGDEVLKDKIEEEIGGALRKLLK